MKNIQIKGLICTFHKYSWLIVCIRQRKSWKIVNNRLPRYTSKILNPSVKTYISFIQILKTWFFSFQKSEKLHLNRKSFNFERYTKSSSERRVILQQNFSFYCSMKFTVVFISNTMEVCVEYCVQTKHTYWLSMSKKSSNICLIITNFISY